jgi:hypothetical protein
VEPIMPHLPLVAAAFAVVLLSVPTSAQNAGPAGPRLDAGTRIRLTVAPSVHAVVGVVIEHRADTLVVRKDADGSTMTIPLGQVVGLDVSHGARTTARRGAVVGLGAGALVGLAVGAVTYRRPNCTDSSFCIDVGPGLDMIADAGVGGLVGLVAGALIGSLSIELWEPATGIVDGRSRVGIAPATRGGVALSASLAF